MLQLEQVQSREITYQKRISNNPGRARTIRNIIGAHGKIEDGAKA
jgi:hypothetical protein